MKLDKFERLAVTLCVLSAIARLNALSVSLALRQALIRTSTIIESDQTWISFYSPLVRAHNRRRSEGKLPWIASETRPGPCSLDTFHCRRSFHARTHQRRTELFRLEVRSNGGIVPCFRRREREKTNTVTDRNLSTRLSLSEALGCERANLFGN